MFNDQHLDRRISQQLLLANELERKNHTSSGKLSASMLGEPLQWQILKLIGVPKKELDEYVLRKFLRGKQVEEWIVSKMSGLLESQRFVEYKDAIGYADAIVDSAEWDLKDGIIVHEVKSVTNMKFKRIQKTKEADHQHKLQGAFYALGLGIKHYAIDYVASDDYRILTFVYEAEELKDEIDRTIAEVNDCLAKGVVPAFKAKLDWQAKDEYCNYPEFLNLNETQIIEKIKKEYPESYKKIKEANDNQN